jgi:citrate synthase
VISTAITRVEDGDLRIRGRDLVAWVSDSGRFEDVVDWMWDGEADGDPWALPAAVAGAVRRVQEAMPDPSPLIDRLRVVAATVSATDPMRFDSSPRGVRSAARRLMLAMTMGLPLRGSEGAGEIADLLWPRLTRRRALPDRRASLNAALALLVDHGLASSTFAARIAASVRADPYSIVSAGMGVVGGTLHGAASAGVHRLLAEAHRLGDPTIAVGELHRRTSSLPGFGHTVYQHEDPRFGALLRAVEKGWGGDARLATVSAVLELISRRTDDPPNIDFGLGALTWLAEMGPEAGEAVFAISRTAGWIAHGLEELTERPLRFRPRGRYTGP